jgi:transglutaminase-like putative cysteine protease
MESHASDKNLSPYLSPTTFIDCDHAEIRETGRQLIDGLKEDVSKVVRLFYFVRDQVRYNPFVPRFLPEHFRASITLSKREGFCVQKAVLLTALARAVSIPARLGFAVLRNHRLPKRLSQFLKGDQLPDHGYTEFFLEGRWVKATPAFDGYTSGRNHMAPVEFDGRHHALLPSHTVAGDPLIEYLSFHGEYADVPFTQISEWLEPALTPLGRRVILEGQKE